MSIIVNIKPTIRKVFNSIRFIVTEWIKKIVLPIILYVPLEIKNAIDVFILRHPHKKLFEESVYNIKNKTPEECDRELERILNVIDDHPDAPIEVFLSDIFIGKPIKEIGMRDLDTAVREYLRCGFDKTKRILKMIHRKGHYLDTKRYCKKISFIDVDQPLDMFYRPVIIQIIRDFVYIVNSIVGCLLGYTPYVTADDIVIWKKIISKDKPTILLIPSTYGFTMLYHPIIRALKNNYNFVCVDTPNIQLRSGRVVNIDTIVTTVTNLLKRDGLTNVHYIGHSFGCIVANQILEKNSGVFKKVVLIEPPILMGINAKMFYDGENKDYQPNMLLNHVHRFTKSNRYLSSFYKTLFKIDHVILNTFKSFAHTYNIFPSKKLLKMMKDGSVVIVLSQDDMIIDYEINKKMFEHFGAKLVVSKSHHGMAIADPVVINNVASIIAKR